MPRRIIVFAAVTLAVIGVDQWSKHRVLGALTTAFDGATGTLGVFYGDAPPAGFDGLHFRPTHDVPLSASYFRVRYAENPGAAFGLFKNLPEHIRGPLFHLVSLGAVVLILFTLRGLKGAADERFAFFGLPLVLGGALGNYVDRLARGFVIDFFEAHWREALWWPAFNVADAAICVGVGLLVVDAFVRRESAESAGQTQPAEVK